MTDFYCPECKKDVGKTAISCPSCGAVKPNGGWPETWMAKTMRERPLLGLAIGLPILAVVGFFLIGGFGVLAVIFRAIFG